MVSGQRAGSTHETVDASVDDGDLDFHGHGLVLTLLYEMKRPVRSYISP